jgi:hypothetical protein
MLYRKAEAIMEYRRQVAMGSDGDDFIVSLLPENEIVFRTKNARALKSLSSAAMADCGRYNAFD